VRHRLLSLAGAVVLFFVAPALHAGCGSSSCPIDTQALNRPALGGFTLDLSFQYIDQDLTALKEPHHDEVRTLSRATTATISYAPTSRLQLSAAIPWIARHHDHLASSHSHALAPRAEHNTIPESWDIRGLGDVVLNARVALTQPNIVTHSAWWAIGGVKLPTGDDGASNDDGEVGELPIQAGTGTYDGIVGLAYEGGLLRSSHLQGPMGDVALVPYFISATYTFRGGATDGYRLGNELQINAGTAYAFTRRFELLLQLNSRFRSKDDIADEPEEEAFTGGTAVFASPGVRVPLGRAGALYGLVQLPLHQDVNGIGLNADPHYIVGLQTRF